MVRRDTYKYQVKIGNKIIHKGITKHLENRGAVCQARWPKSRVVQVGRKTTREAAIVWRRGRKD
jgi:hypothetical protein